MSVYDARLSALRQDYDTLLCDVWGVIHDGKQLFPAAVEALREFKRSGGRICLLSNTPRQSESLIGMLDNMGFPRDAYDCAATSGDTIHQILRNRDGSAAFRIGRNRDFGLLEGLHLDFVPMNDAEFVLCIELDDPDQETPEDYAEVLEAALAKDLELVCANPDVQVQAGDRVIYCAGALAKLYGEMGGRVLFGGKPHSGIYDLALQRLAVHDARQARSRILAIGDGPATDILGANRNNFDALFVHGGISQSIAGNADEFDPIAILRGNDARAHSITDQLVW